MGDKPSNGDDEQSQNETKRSVEKEENKCQPSVNFDERKKLQTGDIQPKMDDELPQPKQNRYVGRGRNEVLVYNTDNGETTECFIKALEPHLGGFKFKNFTEASKEERGTLSIIAVVRHTVMRIDDVLNEVKLQFENANVDDLERVFAIYFYVIKSDEGCKHEIKQISKSGHLNFANIVPMNFIDKCLYRKYFGLLGCLKPDNEKALRELKCIQSGMNLCVNVYGAGDSDRIKAFLAELEQTISSSIELQAMKPLDMLEELISETSPTLICTTGDVEECLRNLTEKGLKKVFLVHIVDVVKRSGMQSDNKKTTSVITEARNTSSTLHFGTGNSIAQNAENMSCEMYEILHYNGNFTCKFYLDLTKAFETFVRSDLLK